MKLTNRFNLPQPVLNVANKRQPHKEGIRTTTLISSPKIKLLERKWHEHIEDDVSNSVWAMFGQGFHKLMEDGADENNVSEQSFAIDINNTTVTGTVDLMSIHQATGEWDIYDYKVTTSWASMQEKPEWELQLNVYRYLAQRNGFKIRSINILAIIRDWTSREAKLDNDYPQAPMVVISIPMWPYDMAETFVSSRVTDHINAQLNDAMGEALPDCDGPDRWYKPGKLAVINKLKTARAVKVFEESEEEKARTFINESKDRENLELHSRSGKSVRCHGFCRVSRFCKQFEAIKEKEIDYVLE